MTSQTLSLPVGRRHSHGFVTAVLMVLMTIIAFAQRSWAADADEPACGYLYAYKVLSRQHANFKHLRQFILAHQEDLVAYRRVNGGPSEDQVVVLVRVNDTAMRQVYEDMRQINEDLAGARQIGGKPNRAVRYVLRATVVLTTIGLVRLGLNVGDWYFGLLPTGLAGLAIGASDFIGGLVLGAAHERFRRREAQNSPLERAKFLKAISELGSQPVAAGGQLGLFVTNKLVFDEAIDQDMANRGFARIGTDGELKDTLKKIQYAKRHFYHEPDIKPVIVPPTNKIPYILVHVESMPQAEFRRLATKLDPTLDAKELSQFYQTRVQSGYMLIEKTPGLLADPAPEDGYGVRDLDLSAAKPLGLFTLFLTRGRLKNHENLSEIAFFSEVSSWVVKPEGNDKINAQLDGVLQRNIMGNRDFNVGDVEKWEGY